METTTPDAPVTLTEFPIARVVEHRFDLDQPYIAEILFGEAFLMGIPRTTITPNTTLFIQDLHGIADRLNQKLEPYKR